MNAIVAFILDLIARIGERLFRESRTASDATRDDASLRRAGGRISEWLRKSRAGAGGKPDSDRP